MSLQSLLVFCIALLIVGASSREEVIELEPFKEVISCIPLSVNVRPRTIEDVTDYSITLNAQDAVVDALGHQVSDGVLQLTAAGDVNVTERVEITVALPKDQLTAVENRNVEVILVDAGFEVSALTVRSEDGVTYVDAIVADALIIDAKGLSRVLAQGEIATATISVDELALVTVNGVQQSAEVKAGATGGIILTGDETKTITGSVSGLGKVFADESASCELTGSGISLKCKDLEGYEMPEISFTWTEYAYFHGLDTCRIRSSEWGSASKTSYVHEGEEKGVPPAASIEGSTEASILTDGSSGLRSKDRTHAGPPIVT